MRGSLRTISSRWVLGAAALLSVTAFGCSSTADDSESSEGAATRGTWKVLNVNYQAQLTGYWCGPASTRIALSARIAVPEQRTIAKSLGTTVDGTDSISQVRDGLNRYLGGDLYDVRTFYRDNGFMSREEAGRFWDDIVQSIDNNYPIVANIVATPSVRPPGYPNKWIYHYVSIIGYNPQNLQVYVADPARFSGIEKYWLDLGTIATLVARRGYTYWMQQGTRCQNTAGLVHGAIEDKYLWLGGCNSFLGGPVGDEIPTPDGNGRYNVFQNGSIYWTEATAAHEVHGAIRDEWATTGWESGFLGYPTTDEIATPDQIGRFNKFQKGSIYWTADTGVHSVHGRIFDKWAELDWEKGKLGYPVSSEYDDGGQRRNDFQHGTIKWDPSSDTLTVTMQENKAQK